MNKRVIIRIYKYYQNLNTCFKLGRCVSKIFKQISSQKRSLTLSLKAKGLINVSDLPRPIRAPKGQSDGTHRACAVLTQTGAFQLRCDVDRVTIKAKPWHGHTNNCRHHWTCKSNQIKMKSKLYVQTYVATSRRQCSCMRYGSVLECFSTECRKNQNQSNHNGQSEVREIPLRTNENSKQTT